MKKCFVIFVLIYIFFSLYHYFANKHTNIKIQFTIIDNSIAIDECFVCYIAFGRLLFPVTDLEALSCI